MRTFASSLSKNRRIKGASKNSINLRKQGASKIFRRAYALICKEIIFGSHLSLATVISFLEVP